MKDTTFAKLQAGLMTALGVLTAAVLLYLWCTPNIAVQNRRALAGYETVEAVSYRELPAPDAPTGIVREYRFALADTAAHDATLAFFFCHQNAEVYLDGEEVYSLRTSDELTCVRTPGVNWAMIPLGHEDAGKEVRVVLTPVYRNYSDQAIEFFVGSKTDIYNAQFMQSLPEMALSLIDILAGVGLLCAALYFSARREGGAGFYPLALLALSLGLWNFAQTEFVPMLFGQKTVFLYYLSITMLLICVIPLIRAGRTPRTQRNGRLPEIWCLVCTAIGTAEMALQLLGVFDLREMLKVTHGMIAVSSLILIVGDAAERRAPGKGSAEKQRLGGVWILGVGAMADMAVYYLGGDSTGLIFVLLAILLYVLLEGVRLIVAYAEQKRLLEEKETQLTLSRITTMMSQIRSHFVFNVLNAISGMCKYDPEKADETIVRFARYLRSNIDILEDDRPVLFSTELSHLEDYVLLEQVRFGDKIEFYADVQTDSFKIPPLILQPVVENAIKHGLTKKAEGGTVILRTWEEGENICLSVEDNGVGFDLREMEESTGVGLKNIRYRLSHLVRGTLKIESRVGEGTNVTITIPKKEAAICM